MFDEETIPPGKQQEHIIGQDLSELSVEELSERIDTLKLEIERLTQAMQQKSSHLKAANSLFKQ